MNVIYQVHCRSLHEQLCLGDGTLARRQHAAHEEGVHGAGVRVAGDAARGRGQRSSVAHYDEIDAREGDDLQVQVQI